MGNTPLQDPPLGGNEKTTLQDRRTVAWQRSGELRSRRVPNPWKRAGCPRP